MKAKRRLRFVAPLVAFFLIGLSLWFSLRHEQLYKVTVLPPLGATCTRPVAINDRCQVAGMADVAGKCHLFLWDRVNGMQDLGPELRFGLDINNAGQIAGTTIDPNGNRQAFLWDPEEGRQMLGTLGGDESVVSALNNNGQVVGFIDSADGQPQPFAWDKTNGMQELERAGHKAVKATAINDAGQVLGSIVHHINPSKPCFWASSEAAPGPAPPLQFPFEYPGRGNLNNNGYVLGRGYRFEKDGYWAFLWRKDTEIRWLFPLENLVLSEAPFVLNDANQVIYCEKHHSTLERINNRLFPPYINRCLWDSKLGDIALDNQIPRELGKLVHVADTNNRGCIVGMIRSRKLGKDLGVLLEPIPERWGK